MTNLRTNDATGRVLLNLSGGIDSSYAAWRWLVDNPYRPLLIHHCRLLNFEGRTQAEDQAVDGVVAWLREQGLDRFQLVKTEFNYGTLPHIVWDIEVIGFITGVILRGKRYPDIRQVIMTTTADDMKLKNIHRRHRRREELTRLMVPRKEVQYLWVNRHLPKAEMVRRMPKELLRATWSCRRPKDDRPCGECYTCKALRGVSP